MNILVIDFDSLMVDFSLRAMAQGHAVRHWMPDKDHRGPILTGKGLVKKIREWQPSMKWADLIVLGTNHKMLWTIDQFRKKGYPVFGQTAETAEWETSRRRGQEVLQRAGVPVADAIPFTSYRDAAAHVSREGKRYVAKPDGDADKALSYVAKGTEDLQFMLEHWHRTQRRGAEFILQEFIPGQEFAVGGFFGPGGWSGPWLENFEHKKLMAGDVGPNTGEMGTIMRYVGESLLADQMLRPLEGELYRAGYTGYIDVAVIVDKRGRPWPLEFTMRFGDPLWKIQQSLHPDTAGWMKDLVDGKDSFKPLYAVACGLQIAMRDFPYLTRPRAESEGFPIFGHEGKVSKFLHPDEVMLGEALGKPMWVSAGTCPLVVSGIGETIVEAAESAHKNIGEVNIPNSPMHRVDIGREKIKERLKTLQGYGYCTEWKHG
jgi:phosphoribosylamine---glycine ligase